MLYRLIEQKRNEWLLSPFCPITEVIRYIETKGMMRDAQVESIKTYLFLKIAGNNRPLWELFAEGFFNSLDLEGIRATPTASRYLSQNKAAAAMLEYSLQENREGKQLFPQLKEHILNDPRDIDFERAFKEIFYNVEYADYLFSLPMGAGKTYLMAAFIYLDLYFAQQDPQNPAFAHNFMILAPSGLKSSIVPSLRTIQKFDPSWVIPEPTASQLKRLIHFEVLDEQKSASKSNRVKNPNAQKLANLQPFDDLFGLIAITNAEKVILDRIDQSADDDLLPVEEKQKIHVANELRRIIGDIPNLSIIIDEVHHAANCEIKLRQVVNMWMKNKARTGVLGFSGTPFLEKAENVRIGSQFSLKNTNLANVVYHYPLALGIGNFLKVPTVKYVDEEADDIVRRGVTDFIDTFGNVVYHDGTCAKLAIYCGKIEKLEECVYPLVAEILGEKGYDPSASILKYHGGNKVYPQPETSEYEFASLDTPLSRIRVVLLVQIGKEGWDCHSLASVILPHANACPRNMVLQTCCRCLRQTQRFSHEAALVWLNKSNADTLNKQLLQRQNINIEEFCSSRDMPLKRINRYSRMEYLKVPPIDFYQLTVSYGILTVKDTPETAVRLNALQGSCTKEAMLIHIQDMQGRELSQYEAEIIQESQTPITFSAWLNDIVKGSFGFLSLNELIEHEELLKKLFNTITIPNKCGWRTLSSAYDHATIKSLIRQAYQPIRDFCSHEDVISSSASLLQIKNLRSPIDVKKTDLYYPTAGKVEDIVKADSSSDQVQLSAEELAFVKLLKSRGAEISFRTENYGERSRTYHYLPYHFDSNLEIKFFSQLLSLKSLKDKNLEFYFNGDDILTEFKIQCYKKGASSWVKLGKYVPDFLILSRSQDNSVYKVIIIETKGAGFAAKHNERRRFMEKEFVPLNNKQFGYPRFSYLYLEDSISVDEMVRRTSKAIEDFFNN